MKRGDNIGLGAAAADAARATEEAAFKAATEALTRQSPPPVPDKWNRRQFHLRGEAGELYDYIIRSCGCYQPKFAEAATLTLLGALLGRGVKNYTGARTNIYTLPIGFTSAGKNDPFAVIQKVTHALGRHQRLLAGEMKSEAALEKTLDEFPVRLLLLDEVGHYFGTLKRGAGGSNGYLMTVIPALTKLWSAANRDHQLGTRATPQEDTKKWRGPTVLHEPCLCVYATSAPRALFSNLTDEDLEDGSLPRYIAFISTTRDEYRSPADEPPPHELITNLDRRLLELGLSRSMYIGGEDRTELPSAPIVIPHTKEALAIMADFETMKTEKLREADNGDPILYLWGKGRENAERVALTVACFNGSDKFVIDAYAAGYAVELMKLTISDMVAAARSQIGKDKVAREREKILDAIRRAGPAGIDGSKLCKLTQSVKPRDRREYLEDLEDNGIITSTPLPSGGPKPKRLYRFTEREEAIQ